MQTIYETLILTKSWNLIYVKISSSIVFCIYHCNIFFIFFFQINRVGPRGSRKIVKYVFVWLRWSLNYQQELLVITMMISFDSIWLKSDLLHDCSSLLIRHCMGDPGKIVSCDRFLTERERWRKLVLFMVINATFNNISVISWQSVLLVEETGVPVENQTTCHKSLTNFIT